MELSDIRDGGGYDLSELDMAKESLSTAESSGVQQVAEKVEPEYIEVIPDAEVVETKEYGTREVFVDYDAYGNIVGIELL